MTEPETPDWVRDAIFYQIFPDRFARSLNVSKPAHLEEWGSTPTPHGYQGGDLIGVIERLDYLTDLGINAIYFTPIFQSASNHRYHTHDYEKVDPMLGGNDALRRLLDAAHARGIRVVLDGVFNHASRGFFQFHDILENGADSAYLDWFTVTGFPLNAYDQDKKPAYSAWWGLPALPKFNTKTLEVREFLWGIGRKWIDYGIDGWRLDVPNEIDDDSFWQEFRKRIRAGNPNAYIVGEVWQDSTRWLNHGDMWDAVMNYQFTRACVAFFIGSNLNEDALKRTSLFPAGPIDAASFRKNIERLLGLYPNSVTAVMLNLLDSHDMARFVTLANGDFSALRLATLFQMTYPGAPSIYYGDEIGMTGGHDPANRGAFPWHRHDTWVMTLLHDFQRLIALRKEYASLRRGSFQFLHAANDVVAYARQLGVETSIVAINVARETRRVDISLSNLLPDATRLDEVWTHQSVETGVGKLAGLRTRATLGTRVREARSAMSQDAPPPKWRLPRGVNVSLWRYAHTPSIAHDEADFFAGHPLFAMDQKLLDERFLKPGRLVDLGCGAGRLSLHCARRGFQVTAVELSHVMLELLGEHASREGLKIDRVRGNLCQLGCIPVGSFEYAISMFSTLGMIRGTAARRASLVEANRILVSNGRLAIHVHNLWLNLKDRQGRLWLLSQMGKALRRDPEFGDRAMLYRGIPGMKVHLYRWNEIRSELKDAGFQIDEVIPIDTVTAQPIRAPWLWQGLRAGGWIIFTHKKE